MNKSRGFTLLELVIFIIILGIIGSSVLIALSAAIRSSAETSKGTTAINLAQSRMTIILGQRTINGFDAFTDPCPGRDVCPSASGYSVSSNITTGWDDGSGTNNNYKIITVTVTGPQSAELKALVAKYGT